MRKNRAQTFTIIRKNGKQYMTHVSNKSFLQRLPEFLKEGVVWFGTIARRIRAFWTGTGNRDYVALTSGRMQMGRR